MEAVDRDNPPYWPGGIPPEIQCHAAPIPSDEVDDEITGWQRFLEENAIPRPPDQPSNNGSYELDRRRALMLQWATMRPEQRLTYHTSSSPTSAPATTTSATRNSRKKTWTPPGAYFVTGADGPYNEPTLVTPRALNCIAPQRMTARQRAAWVKLRILLYKFDGSDDGPLLMEGDASVCVPNPALGERARIVVPRGAGEADKLDKPTSITTTSSSTSGQSQNNDKTESFLAWRFIESADFHRLAMTRSGTVIFPPWFDRGPLLLADEKTLETGLLLLCELENNGQMGTEAATRMLPGELYSMWLYVDPCVLSKSVKEIVCSFGVADEDDLGDA
ncbi:hypothetical protein BD289DRAFT_487282 [Coniella lustricola]|uniref:Uncharacterized protein n=1 Tax=Coniella lustricola TaxID=2025994 RepID=A0A2T2ZSC2_9PEZI|nr:hypothetical protein BD289DRAFT_487282 [Coniella lustricola]